MVDNLPVLANNICVVGSLMACALLLLIGIWEWPVAEPPEDADNSTSYNAPSKDTMSEEDVDKLKW